MFCAHCGKQLNDDDLFCSGCGKPVGESARRGSSSCRERWEGAVFKCPRCGQDMDAYTDRCPSCGYELRDVGAVSSVKELATKIELAKNDEARAALVRSFPIPNSREDIIEFLIMAVTNIDESTPHEAEEESLTKAWIAKANQALQKASIVIPDDGTYKRLKELYEEKIGAVHRGRIWKGMNNAAANGLKLLCKVVGAIMVFYLALMLILAIFL